MTRQQMGGLAFAIRLVGGGCLETSDALTVWLLQNPDVAPEEGRSMASMSHGVPFPSIRGRKEGPFPVYPERPYFDARAHEGAERGPMVVDACGHERSA